ncbi:hemerythrin domain-containing protein [Actinomarinicola tropica]|uniref:Hemerythrin domain-containing protein n=1 Tax=Actinomarinicola tropica TaxID=2789776 RepID=A0A5Q2RLL9_9ACTN|nr:hemerythrin domain-containing protein [Actinomarinicola tropica]QGG96374.1 hemerythrin domain-containing protein [Actinomarinicola tropica]
MDALALLTADHNRVRGLFARFEEAKEAEDVALMADLCQQIFTELEVHTSIEEDIFYPEVRDESEDLQEVVDEGIEEHHVVDVLMEEMKALEPGSDEWVAKMTVLIENVEHHAEEEESEMFPEVRSQTSAEFLDSMAEKLESRKKQLGAPTLADKIDLTKAELDEKAKEQQIPGRSKMDHDELAATVAP